MPKKKKAEVNEVKNHGQEKRKISGKRGKLAYMRDLPLDLVYEICSHLEPFDLLRLSRASRELRRMLLTKASQSMWRRARANSGIPEPIGSMSEPAFASLIFEAHCSFCFAPNVRNISWLAQRRVCKKCIEKYFDVQHTFIITKTLSIPSPLWKTVPRCWLKMASWGGIQVGEGITIGYYLTSAVEDVAKEYAATQASQREAWIEEKVKIGDAVNQNIDHCIKWDEERSVNRTNTLQDARAQRLNAIVERLGWSNVLTQSTQFRTHKLVNQAKPITARTWKTIQPQLEAFKEQLESQLQIEFAQARYECLRLILREAEHTLARDLIMPPDVDFALSEPYKSIIDFPLERGTDRTLFSDVVEAIPQTIQRWNQARTQVFLQLLQTRFPNAMESDLSACTSLFNCASCIRGGCQCHGLYSLDSSFATTVPEWYKTGDFPVVWPSSLMNVRLCTKGIDRAQEVARLLDMDPSKTPASTMLTLNPFVECISCGTPEEKCFLRWTSVVAHGAHEFRAVSQKHAEIVKKLEEKIIPNIRRNENSQEHELALENNFMRHDKRLVAFCKRCGYRDHEEDEIERHVTQSHGASVVSAQDWEFVAFGPLCFRGVKIKGDARLFLS
ncbi:hypothetical protein PM082_021225 [Marasmius tenuissimus]|nr:hypothetical protein PM082_021225 [Marasmius tenuissimus]